MWKRAFSPPAPHFHVSASSHFGRHRTHAGTHRDTGSDRDESVASHGSTRTDVKLGLPAVFPWQRVLCRVPATLPRQPFAVYFPVRRQARNRSTVEKIYKRHRGRKGKRKKHCDLLFMSIAIHVQEQSTTLTLDVAWHASNLIPF